MKTNIENKYWIQVLIEIKLKSNLRLNSIFKRIWDKDIENRFEDNLIEIPFVLTFPPFLNLMSGKWGLIVCNWDVRQLKTIVIDINEEKITYFPNSLCIWTHFCRIQWISWIQLNQNWVKNIWKIFRILFCK